MKKFALNEDDYTNECMTMIDVSLIHCRCLVISHLVNCSRSFGTLNAAYGDKCGARHTAPIITGLLLLIQCMHSVPSAFERDYPGRPSQCNAEFTVID